ncbi:Adaptive-response sensory-kinase SasA [Candidatus Entotheonellaceae bacterium PAL068K]
MRIRSIRARLTLWYTGLLTVTLLVLGGVAYGLLLYSLAHEMDVALHSVAQTLAEQARQETSRFIARDIDAVFQRFFGVSPLDRYFEMLDHIGRPDPRWRQLQTSTLPLSQQALHNAEVGLTTLETVNSLEDYPVRLLTRPIFRGGRLVRLVQVGMSLQSLHQTRRRFVLIMTGVLPLGLLLASGGGWLLARHALAPVGCMIAAAQRMSAAHLGERLDETGTDDELDRLARTLNAMLGRLDDAFRQIRQFSADASHELQTPLTILQGELEVALRTPRSPADYQRHLHSALEEIDRIAALVDGLLLLARADAGVLRMDRRPVDLAPLVLEVYEATRVLAERQQVTLDLGQMESAMLQGDRERLRRLLLNLVDNAIKYTPRGGRVTLSLQKQGNWTALQVCDTGIGLSAEEQAQVCKRFYRTVQAREQGQGGSGLGLCIAQSIAAAHAGRILINSLPGQGSTFTVLLPLPGPARAPGSPVLLS